MPSVVTSKFQSGGFAYGLGRIPAATLVAGANADFPQTNPLTPITADRLVIDGGNEVAAGDNDSMHLRTLTVNDVDLLIFISGETESGFNWANSDSKVSPSFMIGITQQDVVTCNLINNNGANATAATAAWSGAYTAPGTGIETATPAVAPQFGSGRVIGMGSDAAGASTTFSGKINTHQRLALQWYVAQCADRDTLIQRFQINDEDLATGLSVAADRGIGMQFYQPDMNQHPMYDLLVDSSDTLTVSVDAHTAYFSSAFMARIA